MTFSKKLLTISVVFLCMMLSVGAVSAGASPSYGDTGVSETTSVAASDSYAERSIAIGWTDELAEYLHNLLTYHGDSDDMEFSQVQTNPLLDLYTADELAALEEAFGLYYSDYLILKEMHGVMYLGETRNTATTATGTPVTTAQELMAIDPTGSYYLANNIDLTGVTWSPIGVAGTGTMFVGTFDGNGYTISNLNINSDTANYGLFGVVGSGATITDLTIEDFTIDGTAANSGFLIGSIVGTSGGDPITISDITVNGGTNTVRVVNAENERTDAFVGGIVGQVSGAANVNFVDITVKNINISVEMGHRIGGIIGCPTGSGTVVNLDNCDVLDSKISTASGNNVGGAIGHVSYYASATLNSECLIDGCTVYTASGNYVGGAIGAVYNYASATIEGDGNVIVSNCSISTASGYAVGGAIGYVHHDASATLNDVGVENCVITASGAAVGGAIGYVAYYASATLSEVWVENCVVRGSTGVGGLIGSVYGETSASASTATLNKCQSIRETIVGSNGVGGMVGRVVNSNCLTTECLTTQSIVRGGSNVGGVVGLWSYTA